MHWRTELPQFKSGIVSPQTKTAPAYFCFQGAQLIVGPAPGPWQPLNENELRATNAPIQSEHYLGTLDGADCFAVGIARDTQLAQGFSLIGLRQLLGKVDEELFYIAGRAVQIVDWDRSHQFCGGCGQPTRLQNDRAHVCDSCGIPAYPRLSPSIIVLVTKGDQMLLARNAAWGPNGFYSTLAGFVEPGESVEETVHREVYEEVGISVTNLKYLGSQSWPFPNSLMLGFHAEYAGGEFQFHDAEIADAQWFDIDAMPKVPGGFAISRWLIDAFIEKVRGG
jgi:NAD+ diphosphatase